MHPLSPGAYALREIDIVLQTVQAGIRALMPTVLLALLAVAVVGVLAFEAFRLHARRTRAAQELKVAPGLAGQARRRWLVDPGKWN